MRDYDVEEVFVPNDVPTVTYVYRKEHDLDRQLRSALKTPKVIISLSGPSKSGKTVLINRTISKDNLIQVSGGAISSAEGLWDRILNWMDLPTEAAAARTIGGQFEASAKGSVRTGIPLVAFGSGELAAKAGGSFGSTASEKYGRQGIDQVVKEIADSDFIVFIDDYHYMEKSVQVEVAKQIKEAAEKGVRICTASVPHRSDDVVRGNPELRGRVQAVDFEYWTDTEIREIASQGFKALKVSLPETTIDRLTKESFGSPQLMQSICLQLCRVLQIERTLNAEANIEPSEEEIHRALRFTSSITDFSSILEGLHAGPKQRGQERSQFAFTDGTSGDVYRCILLALKADPPRLSLPYDEIYTRSRELCDEVAPVGSSINNALMQMNDIAIDLEPSSKIVEWNENVFDIADPYFLFYIRCSNRLNTLSQPART